MLSVYLSVGVSAPVSAIKGYLKYFYSSFSLFSFQALKIKLVSLSLLISILTTTTFAAASPPAMIHSAGEFGQNIRYTYLTSPVASWLTSSSLGSIFNFDPASNPVLGFFFSRDNSAKNKQQQIAGIKVSPNGATIREGQEIYFNAMALDSQGNVIQGVRFNWTAIDEKQKSPLKTLENGKFEPQFYGNFVVTAEANGIRSQVLIKVKRDDIMVYGKELEAAKEAEATGNDGNKPIKTRNPRAALRPTKIDKTQAMPPPLEVSSRRDSPGSARAKQAIVKQNTGRMPQPDGKNVVGLKINCSPDNPYYPDCGYTEADSSKAKLPAGQETTLKPIKYTPGQVINNLGNRTGGNQESIFKTLKYTPEKDLSSRAADSSEVTDPTCPTDYESLGIAMLGDPSAAVLNTRLFVFIRGTDNAVYWKYSDDGNSFSNWLSLGGGTYNNPRTAVINGVLYLEVTGTDSNNYYKSTSDGGASWSTWVQASVNAQTTAGTTFQGRSFQFAHGSGDLIPLCVNIIGGGCNVANYNASDGWNNLNYTTADDPGQQPGSPTNVGMNMAGSGNFSFSAPVVSLGARGDLNMSLALTYNSLLWHSANGEINYDIDKGFPAPGWTIGFGKLMDMGSSGGAMLEDPNGTRHSYEGVITSYYAGYTNYTGRTTDGSFIDYTVYRSPAGITGGYAHLANGTFIEYGAASDGVAYPTYLKDRHGNYMTISYCNNAGPKINNITDDLGRIIQFNYDSNGHLTSISGPGFNNTNEVFVKIHYSSMPLTGTFSGLTPLVRTSTPDIIDAIYYPGTHTGYWFGDDNTTANPSYSPYGMIAKVMEQRNMTEPTPGVFGKGDNTRQLLYSYPMAAASNLTEAPKYGSLTEDWYGRDTVTTPVAVTSYNIVSTAVAPAPLMNAITLPDGNTITQFTRNDPTAGDNGMSYMIDTRSPAPASLLLGKTETTWEAGDYGTIRPTLVQTTDEKGQVTKQAFTYESILNQVSTIKEYGIGSSTVFRTTAMAYQNDNYWRGYYASNGYWSYGEHIFSLLTRKDIYQGDSAAASPVRMSRVDYHYDQSNLMDAPNVVMYDQEYNPYNPNTVQGPNCVNWQWDDWGDGYGQYICTEYEQVPDFLSYTLARGNRTNTTNFADAANGTGAISYDSTYDITGNLRTTITNCCQQMSFDYSTATQYSQPDAHSKGSPTDASYRMTESATYDFDTGVMKTSTDFNGLTTTVIYDQNTVRPIEVISPPLGTQPQGKKTTVYDDANLTVTEKILDAGGNPAGASKAYFNGRKQTYKSETLAGADWTAAVVNYDTMGRTTQTSMPFDLSVSTTPSYWTTYHYDLMSRVDIVTAPDLSQTKTDYNNAAGSKPSSAASDVGQTVKTTDAWGREHWARTDEFGRPAEVVESNPLGTGSVTASGNMVTTYQYDALDRLTEVDQGNQKRKFGYDSLGRVVRQKLAEAAGTLDAAGSFSATSTTGWSDLFQYDNRSNLTQRTDARGVVTTFNYQLTGGGADPLNRLQSVNYTNTQNDPNIAPAPTVTIGYMTGGDKTRAATVTTAGVSIETNSYDALSRIQFYNLTLNGRTSNPFITEYGYDTVNRLTSVSYPTAYGTSLPSKVVTPGYDNASRLTEIKVNNANQLSDIVYNPIGQVTSLKTGLATGNPDTESYDYDPSTGLLTNQKVMKTNSPTPPLLDLSYEYNRLGSNGSSTSGKTGQLTKIINNRDQNKNRIYEFDTLGRLRKAYGGIGAGGVQTGTLPAVTADWTQGYEYDRYGNRTNVTKTGAAAAGQPALPLDGLPGMTYDDQTNRITNTNYEYDPAGNQTRGQNPTGSFNRFQYDEAGRLVKVMDDNSVPLETYTYGSSRQRLTTKNETTSQKTYYVWGGSSVLCEYTEASSATSPTYSKSYIYAGARLLSTSINNGGTETTEFHHPDRLGTKLVTNDDAITSYEQSTLPFGTALDAEDIGTITTNQRFTSYERNDTTKLDYAVNRIYSSGQGRFTQVDPAQDGLNLYAYTGNNPIDFIDPSGLLRQIDYGSCQYVGWLFVGDGREGQVVDVYVCNTVDVNPQPDVQPSDGGGGGPGNEGGTHPKPQDDCDVQIPTDTDGKAVVGTIIGEATSWEGGLKQGNSYASYQTGSYQPNAMPKPQGNAINAGTFQLEADYMASALFNRLESGKYGNSLDDVASQEGQFLGYTSGTAALDGSFGKNGSPACERLRAAVNAYNKVKNGQFRSAALNWRGVLQPTNIKIPPKKKGGKTRSVRGTYIRDLGNGTRINNTDFF